MLPLAGSNRLVTLELSNNKITELTTLITVAKDLNHLMVLKLTVSISQCI